MWNQTRLTAELGIEYPIVQGPLGGLSSQRLTAADVSAIAGPVDQWSAQRREHSRA